MLYALILKSLTLTFIPQFPAKAKYTCSPLNMFYRYDVPSFLFGNDFMQNN